MIPPGTHLRWLKPGSGHSLVLYQGEMSGFALVATPGALARHPEIARSEELEVWSCAVHDHHVSTWEERGRRGSTSVERGTCDVCAEVAIREMLIPDAGLVVCGLCEGTGFVRTAHQAAANVLNDKVYRYSDTDALDRVRGTRPCSACAPDPTRV